jgi:hypothetical protein
MAIYLSLKSTLPDTPYRQASAILHLPAFTAAFFVLKQACLILDFAS